MKNRNAYYRIRVVSTPVFSVDLFQSFCVGDIFSKKMLPKFCLSHFIATCEAGCTTHQAQHPFPFPTNTHFSLHYSLGVLLRLTLALTPKGLYPLAFDGHFDRHMPKISPGRHLLALASGTGLSCS